MCSLLMGWLSAIQCKMIHKKGNRLKRMEGKKACCILHLSCLLGHCSGENEAGLFCPNLLSAANIRYDLAKI